MRLDNYQSIIDYVGIMNGVEIDDKTQLKVVSMINQMLAYCNREDITQQMEFVFAEIVANELENNLGQFNNNVSSYSEGDMSISFGGNDNNVKFGGKLEGFKLIRGLKDV